MEYRQTKGAIMFSASKGDPNTPVPEMSLLQGGAPAAEKGRYAYGYVSALQKGFYPADSHVIRGAEQESLLFLLKCNTL